jgi:signal transduction histidine kinase
MQKGREHLETVKILRDPTPWLIMGNIYNTIGELGKSEISFREGIKLSGEFNALFIRAVLYNALAGIFYQRNTLDSAIYYASQSLLLSRKNNYKLFEKYSAGTLAFIYDTISADSALKYMKIMSAANDEAFSQAKVREFQNVGLDDERRQRELEKESIRLRNKIRLYALLAALFVFFVIALIFWRNSKQKHRANILLRTQKERAENTLIDLKATQAQLIQSEKMASLGELTAGIAHEIQNPLNFVNNFSELNTELIEEMKNEIDKGDIEEIKAITNILEKNEQKINQQGKRADAIVKGMLQHSRASTGKKESTNLNALADEYLRLAYHGLRAKDKDFNTTMKTDFDEGIGNINIIPQDIGRVLLNLYNNAFYAVTEKKKREDDYYEPTVTLSTKRLASHSGDGGKVEIKVADNGNGIPQNVIDKIFQPFFTTKPTGQGTGLGLSLSYDIIKAHGGEIKVETKEGEGSEFLIFLSIT